MNNFYINNLQTIYLDKGNLFKGLSIHDNNYNGFGEIYFTTITPNLIKGWKKHLKMTLNIIVLTGSVKFVIKDKLNPIDTSFTNFKMTEEKKQILTILPNNWFAFQGLGNNLSMITNIANLPHDDLEVENKNLDEFNYNWTSV